MFTKTLYLQISKEYAERSRRNENPELISSPCLFLSLFLSLSLFFPPSFVFLFSSQIERYRIRVSSLPRGLRGVETVSAGGCGGGKGKQWRWGSWEEEGWGGVAGRKRREGVQCRAAGGWCVDVTVTASSAAWANGCALTLESLVHRSAADCCCVRVPGMTCEMTSSLAPFASRRRAAPRLPPSSLLSAPRSQPPSPSLHTVRF